MADAPPAEGARRCVFFEHLGAGDGALVGGKNSSLGEMITKLGGAGVRVPHGFALTSAAYADVMAQTFVPIPPPSLARALVDGETNAITVGEALKKALATLTDPDDTKQLHTVGKACREIVSNAPLPRDLVAEIGEAAAKLRARYGDAGTELTVAVRSSATAEDLPDASFAGQHDSYLGVPAKGKALLSAIIACFASLYTDRAIRYRIDRGFRHEDVLMSVGVMGMVRSDKASAGVMFSVDTESGHPGVVFLTSSYGLGENVVQGAVDPDEFLVHKATYQQGKRAVMSRRIGAKKISMVYKRNATLAKTVKNFPTPRDMRSRQSITDGEALELAGYAIKIEKHYGRPMDIEWAKDGVDGKLWIVQARPETVASQSRANEVLVEYNLRATDEHAVLAKGRAVGGKVASGIARVITTLEQLSEFRAGEVLVADMTTPDWGSVMKRACAIVTNRGGRTCHAAIISRELGLPAVIGTSTGTSDIKTGDLVTVSCADGDSGHVYAGEVPFERIETNLCGLPRPKSVKLLVNVGNPESALKNALLPSDGVGLARLEFIINDAIGVHPMALLHPERIADEAVRARVLERAERFLNPSDFFIERLAEGVGTIAGAFYPRPVVVRLSDFKSNEYRSMLGGEAFEPEEENPMLGFRGAFRYTHPDFEEAFELEIAALKIVRETMGFTNVKLMIPFCRSPREAEAVLAKMAEGGLCRGENGLEVLCMCELPVNVLLMDDFSKHFDGFSIGSNDLTQLTLGVDRDSSIVAEAFDECSAAMTRFLQMAIDGAKRNGRYIGICGQAPSDHPAIAQFLMQHGIDSMSLNPDTVVKAGVALAKAEGGQTGVMQEHVLAEAA